MSTTTVVDKLEVARAELGAILEEIRDMRAVLAKPRYGENVTDKEAAGLEERYALD